MRINESIIIIIISFTSYWSVSISSDKVQDRSIAGRGHLKGSFE